MAQYTTYYFDACNPGEIWETNSQNMIDGDHASYAFTTIDGDVELLNSNTCSGTDLGTIIKVELRTYATYAAGTTHKIILRPVFSGTDDGDNHTISITGTEWTAWQNITNDTNAPTTWSWSNITNLDCDVEADITGGAWLSCGKVEIRVTYVSVSTFTISLLFDKKEVSITNVNVDGYIRYEAPSTYDQNNWYRQLGFGKITTNIARGYVEWDISSIPDTAVIDKVSFLYHSWRHRIDGHIHECLDERPSSSASNGDLYTACGEGTVYADEAGFPVEGSNQVITLGATSSASACIDLQNQLSNDWFAIGFQSDNEGTLAYNYISTESATDITPAPTLYVEYQSGTNTICNLTQPHTITHKHTRKTESHLFPDGTFKQHDVGSGGKIFTLSGIEYGNASATCLDCIDTITKVGKKITISGMSYDVLNTTWYIADFTWNQNEAYTNRYDWTMVLKET